MDLDLEQGGPRQSVEERAETFDLGPDGLEADPVAAFQRKQFGLDPLQRRDRARNRVAKPFDGPEMLRFLSLDEQRKTAPEDIEAQKKRVTARLRLAGAVSVERAEEPQVFDLGLGGKPTSRTFIGELGVLEEGQTVHAPNQARREGDDRERQPDVGPEDRSRPHWTLNSWSCQTILLRVSRLCESAPLLFG